ncbi:hypothetical protein ATZ36_13165 [Candidatus Endomicrobiellum trichonymphae]|uniref:DNA recombination protein RmuC n=1 Tax=Endomicrobium trichonymphae TaxID=1408204 RepID=A0A1E5IMN2_ENDTX|nr:hypothetical protein ATZ36_13165 [Candidatus Endomicrobium trichonymphae]
MAKMVSGLQGQLGIMVQSTKQVSEDANSLANALKGNNSFHGKWGEHSLERMLEIAGMTKGVDHELQKRFNDGEDKPDCVINLPDGKHIVIDVKTSFVAYEKYYNPQNETDKKIHLKEHFASIKNHIDKLIKKNYVSLPGTNQPDYVVMFVPLDGAVSLAIEYEQDIIGYALRNNIVIATPLTLLSMLKTIQYIWRQENQKKNVIEIAELAGYIHDKYAELFQSLQSVDKKISEAQVKTQDAIKKLSTADKKGESIIKRLQKMKSLGVPTKKEIPEDLLKTVE